MPTREPSQQALYLTTAEAEVLQRRIRHCRFLLDRGIEVYTVSAEPMVMHDGSKSPAVRLMVRAPSDMTCGMGVGFVVALSEGGAR
jgi:hypothetical protein